MSDIEDLNNEIVSPDDGLTDRERAFITTPMNKMSPESVRYGLGMVEKRAEHNYRLNDEFRRQQEAARE